MPLRFQNVCRHRQTNNTGRLPPILAPHTLFSHFPAPLLSNFPAFPENLLPAVSRRPAPHALFPHLSCRASFKLSRLSRKSPAGRFTPPRTAHVVSSPFLPRFFQTFPPFPKISCQPSSADPHTTHVVSSPFLPRFFQTFPPFPKISCQPSSADPHTARVVSSPFPKISCRPFHAAPHRTRCFLTFPAALLSSLPTFPENLLPAVSCRPAPHALFPCFPVLFTAPLPDVFVSSF